jgi:hypothetical protein
MKNAAKDTERNFSFKRVIDGQSNFIYDWIQSLGADPDLLEI